MIVRPLPFAGGASFSFLLILLGGLLIRHGLKLRKNQDRFENIKTYLQRYKKVKISKLAKMIDESELETVSILDEMEERGEIQGIYQEDDGEQYFVYNEYAVNSEDYEI
ncbi:MAG: hypothetical protein ACOCTR_06395 [Candidatus Natronoplasma sp.]